MIANVAVNYITHSGVRLTQTKANFRCHCINSCFTFAEYRIDGGRFRYSGKAKLNFSYQ